MGSWLYVYTSATDIYIGDIYLNSFLQITARAAVCVLCLYVLHERGGLSGYEIAKVINEITGGFFPDTREHLPGADESSGARAHRTKKKPLPVTVP